MIVLTGIRQKMEKMVGSSNMIRNMKNFKFTYALMAVILFVTACSDEELINQGKVPAADGSEIIFGSRAGFENNNAKGRTVYSGEEYQYGDIWYERIDWIEGDMIQIYSPQASNGPTSHYKVTSIKSGDESGKDGTNKGSDYAYLERLGENGLQWNGDEKHDFYAMYPSSEMFAGMTGVTVPQGLSMEEGSGKVLVNGIVPISQDGTISHDGNGNYTIAPNMKYAYMVAKTKADRSNESVGLSFVPIVTALEIEMKVPEDSEEGVNIANIQIQGEGIAGNFTADLSNWDVNKGYPACTNQGEGSNYITISTRLDYNPITIAKGKSIKFTVFLRPTANYSNLKVGYAPAGVFVNKLLDGVTIPMNIKTQITNLYLPAKYKEQEGIVIDASKWMSQLPKTTKMKKLSIPGTGGSFSYNYSSDNTGIYRGQHTHMNLDAQWAKGIRAFEIITDMQASNFGDEKLKCNKVEMGPDVQTVVKDILNKLASTHNEETDMYETAMVIFTYQPEGNSPARDPGTYMKKLMTYINTLDATRLVRFSPDLTLGVAQNKLMIVVRPTQNDEDEADDWTSVKNNISGPNAEKVLAINGCGTAKDRWGARGYELTTQTCVRSNRQNTYTVNTTRQRAADISNYVSETNRNPSGWGSGTSTYLYYDYVEAYLQQDQSYALSSDNPIFEMKPQYGEGTLSITRGNTKFNFETNADYECWFQEWQRVVKENVYKASGRWGGYNASYPAVYWFESLNEKYSNIVEAFDMSISDDYNFVFINSLCGYLAAVGDNTDCLVPSIDDAWGGSSGNIKALADELNDRFGKYVYDKGQGQITGPTGIILMNYVNNKLDTALDFDGSFHLPDMIIENNFKHSLEDDLNNQGGNNQGGNNQSGTGDGTGNGGDI